MSRRKTILVVEDEPSLRFLAVKILEMAGHLVLSAENAEETMEIWMRVGRGVDLLVTDVIMPGWDGIELARQLRGARPDLRVMFVTGSIDRIAEMRELGGRIEIVQKPYSVQTLREAVEQMLRFEE
jgi:two-component system, cell cycle sensor histidine kinase and response regulator CckA